MDFPDPDAPTSAIVQPCGTSNDTPSSAVLRPPCEKDTSRNDKCPRPRPTAGPGLVVIDDQRAARAHELLDVGDGGGVVANQCLRLQLESMTREENAPCRSCKTGNRVQTRRLS